MAADYDRIEKERKTWCTNYGATLDEFGHCWDLENAYDSCAKAQKFWSTTDPENYGVGKQIKLRDGFEITNQLGHFEYPCTFPRFPPLKIRFVRRLTVVLSIQVLVMEVEHYQFIERNKIQTLLLKNGTLLLKKSEWNITL